MACPNIPSLLYKKFSRDLYERALRERLPLCGTMELTLRCNLNCVHCYCRYDHRKREMDCTEIRRVIDAISDAGCLWLLITGGEPLARPDFPDIYLYAKKKGLIITLFTNGTLCTPELADCLKDYPPFSVEISLYGATEKTYESVTQVQGSFKRCLRGIDLLMERNLPLSLKTMVLNLNLAEFFEIEGLARKKGLKFRFDAAINPGLDGSKEPCKFRVTPENILELDMASAERVKAWKKYCQKFVRPAATDKLFSCGAGVCSFHIDPCGSLSICEMTRHPNFDLRTGSFKKYWQEDIPEVLSRKPEGGYKCGRCDLLSLCGQCPGWSQLENGNPEEPVEYLCRIAHLRAEAFGTAYSRDV